MSMLPAFEAVVNNSLSREDTRKLVDNIKSLKGVLSASFHGCCGGCQSCSRESSIYVTYDGNPDTQAAVQKLPGVVKLKPLM